MKKTGLMALSVAVFACALPPETWAQEAPRARSVEDEYARREAQAANLEGFKGGCPGPDGPVLVLLILTLPVTLPIFGLYKLGEVTVHGIKALFGGKPAPSPTAPRNERPAPRPRPEAPADPGGLPLSVQPLGIAPRIP